MSAEMQSQHQATLEECRQSVADQVKQARRAVKAAEAEVARELERACQTTADFQTQHSVALKKCQQAIGDELEATRAAVGTVQADCLQVFEGIRKVEADARDKLQLVGRQTEEYDKRLTAMAEAQKRTGQLIQDANNATARLQIGTKRAADATQSLASQSDRAAEVKAECCSTLERIEAEKIKAIELAATEAESRLAEGMARFEGVIATEENARNAAEKTVRIAQTTLLKIKETEAKLAEAQESAIHIEATASAALASVHKQVKKIEDTVAVVVRSGVDRATSDISLAIDECGKQAKQASQTVENTASLAIRRVRDDVASAIDRKSVV